MHVVRHEHPTLCVESQWRCTARRRHSPAPTSVRVGPPAVHTWPCGAAPLPLPPPVPHVRLPVPVLRQRHAWLQPSPVWSLSVGAHRSHAYRWVASLEGQCVVHATRRDAPQHHTHLQLAFCLRHQFSSGRLMLCCSCCHAGRGFTVLVQLRTTVERNTNATPRGPRLFSNVARSHRRRHTATACSAYLGLGNRLLRFGSLQRRLARGNVLVPGVKLLAFRILPPALPLHSHCRLLHRRLAPLDPL